MPSALLNVLGSQLKREFNSVSYAADKTMVDTIRAAHPDLPSTEGILADLCLGKLGVSREDIGQADRLRLLFDRDEPFIRHLKHPWQNGRKNLSRQSEEGWPTQIRQIEPAKSEDHPGIQAADLLSWTVRAKHEYGDQPYDANVPIVLFTFLMAARLQGELLDEATIRTVYVEKRPAKLLYPHTFL